MLHAFTSVACTFRVMPGQQAVKFDISPENYEFDIQAMSSEMLPFILPAVFTIGAKLELHELELYAQLLTSSDLTAKVWTGRGQGVCLRPMGQLQ